MSAHRQALRRIVQAGVLVAASCVTARAATLDASSSGGDVTLTWDSGLPDTLLRGPTPDALVPWQAGVSSPFVATGENTARGENAFYRLVSGSNMAFRLEVSARSEPSAVDVFLYMSLPERRSYRARDLFDMWPELMELLWWDSAQRRYEALARFPHGILGDDEELPRHGGVRAAFRAPATITIVGSHDDSYAGMDATDLPAERAFPDDPRYRFVAVPPHQVSRSAFDLICGDIGVDWFDVDGDGKPDDRCGTDLDGDGLTDTGLWKNCATPDPACGRRIYISGLAEWGLGTVGVSWFRGNAYYLYPDLMIPPGLGVRLVTSHDSDALPADLLLNLPFRRPTW